MSDKMTVIYNDSCPICSREVESYRRMTERGGLEVAYVGLSEETYQRFGLTADEAARRFHVLKGGRLLSGVPAFAALWNEMPRLRWLARLVQVWGVRWVARQTYDRLLAPALYAMHKRRQRRAGRSGNP